MNAPIGDSVGALLGLVALAVGLALYVWTALALAAMFRKMGEAPYKGWVPVWNVATLLRWGGFSPWLVLIGLFPVLGPIALWVLVVVAAHRINPGFGYGGGMTALAAVLFVVWASILGFGPARWLGARAGGMSAHRREQPRASLGGVFAEPAPMTPEVAVVSALPPAAAAEPAAPSDDVREDDDDLARLFAPPAPAAAPAWTPPETTVPPASPSTVAPAPAETAPAEPAPARPDAGTVAVDALDALDEPVATSSPSPAAVVRPPAPAPVSASAAVRAGEAAADDDAAWPSEIDDVSAIAPSPFPPSSGAGWRHAMPPVTDDAPIDFVPGRRSTALPSPHDVGEAADAPAPAPRVSAAAAAARAAHGVPAEPAADASDSAVDGSQAGSSDAPAAGERQLAPEAAEPPLRRARPWPAFAVAPNEPDGFPELSGEVSAVIGSPAAGSPRSAAGAVAAQHRRDQSVDDDIDQTVITRRVRAAVWQLVPAAGAPVAITADVVILGRRPAADTAFPKAQLIAVAGEALTVSKTHARLERHDDVWTITDLASTNGVLVRTFMGEEIEVEPGSKIDAGERFFLGDEEFHLARIER